MKKNKVLIITSWFWQNKSPRSHRSVELARELVKQGFEVHVLCDDETSINRIIENAIGVKVLNFEKISFFQRIPTNKLGKFIYKIANVLVNYPEINYFFQIRKKFSSFESYDALITISAPFSIAWGVASFSKIDIKKKFKVWIADFGDPFMYSTALKYRPLFYFHFFEWNVLRKVDFLTVPFEDMKRFFYKRFIHKIKVIPQGVSLDVKIETYKKNVPIRIGFAGRIYPGKRDIFSLLDYLILKKFDFEFEIFTDQPELYTKYNNPEKKINFRNYIEREKLIQELSRLDFLIAVDLDEISDRTSAIPSKIIDYGLAKRPILKYQHSKLPIEKVYNFMNYNFYDSYNIDITNYDTRTVTKKFIELFIVE